MLLCFQGLNSGVPCFAQGSLVRGLNFGAQLDSQAQPGIKSHFPYPTPAPGWATAPLTGARLGVGDSYAPFVGRRCSPPGEAPRQTNGLGYKTGASAPGGLIRASGASPTTVRIPP